MEHQHVARKIIQRKYEEMGDLTWHEKCVGLAFILAVLLWFFRKPEFIPGWAEVITEQYVIKITHTNITNYLLLLCY